MKKFNVTVNGTAYDVEVNEVKAAAPAAAPKAAPAAAPKAAPAPAPAPAAAAAPVPAGAETVKAPMPGKLYPLAMIWLFLANTKCCLMARLRRVI